MPPPMTLPKVSRSGSPAAVGAAGQAPVAGVAGAEAGEDLVEDQQGAVFAGDPGQGRVEARRRG